MTCLSADSDATAPSSGIRAGTPMATTRHSHSEAAHARWLAASTQARRALDSPACGPAPGLRNPVAPRSEALNTALEDERRGQTGRGCGPTGPWTLLFVFHCRRNPSPDEWLPI